MFRISLCSFVILTASAQFIPAAVSLPLGKDISTLPTKSDGPAKPAMAAFREGHHAKAVELAKPLAAEGNPDALYLMGYAHETGQGADASREIALEYYRKAADAKHKDAVYRMSFLLLGSEKPEEREKAGKALEAASQEDPEVAARILGEAYLRGLLTKEPDPNKAIQWWKKSAEHGDVTSMTMIARFYEGEFGFPEKKNAKLALDYYAKAAELGNTGAMVILGSRYLSGESSLRDEQKGRGWLQKAIAAKEATAFLVLADYEENVKKDLKAALALYEGGKDAGQADCILRTAGFYLDGKGVAKDEERGLALLQEAAKAGHPTANLQLAVAYLSPEKISTDDAIRGYQHLVFAANSNLAQAQCELGLLYLSGKLGHADGPAAVAWLTRAAQGGHPQAQFHLASLYLRGVAGVAQNLQTAGELFSLAANQGHGGSMLALAQMHATGTGTTKDPVKAWVLASLASEAGENGAEALAKEIHGSMTVVEKSRAKEELAKTKSGQGKESSRK